MTIFLAGQVPTAEELQAVVGIRVAQGTAQSVASSTTLVDSGIRVPVNGPAEITLAARYTTGSPGGGIGWAWGVTGTVVMLSRTVISPGSNATAINSTHSIDNLRMRQIATPEELHTIANYSASTTQALTERVEVDGVGELVFRFAQQASHATATVLHATSSASSRPLRAI